MCAAGRGFGTVDQTDVAEMVDDGGLKRQDSIMCVDGAAIGYEVTRRNAMYPPNIDQ